MRRIIASFIMLVSSIVGTVVVSDVANAGGVTTPNIPSNRNWNGYAVKCVYWPSGITGYWPNYAPEYAPRWEIKVLTTLKRRSTVLGPSTDHHDFFSASWGYITGITGNSFPQVAPWFGVTPSGFPRDHWSFYVKGLPPGAAEPQFMQEWQPVSWDGAWDPYYYRNTNITGPFTDCMTNRTNWLIGQAPW